MHKNVILQIISCGFMLQVISFSVLHAMVHGHFGRALRLLVRQQDERMTRENDEKIIRAMRGLKWDHAAHLFELSFPVRYPHAYHPF
jgi:tripeptidyl-peptidase-2